MAHLDATLDPVVESHVDSSRSLLLSNVIGEVVGCQIVGDHHGGRLGMAHLFQSRSDGHMCSPSFGHSVSPTFLRACISGEPKNSTGTVVFLSRRAAAKPWSAIVVRSAGDNIGASCPSGKNSIASRCVRRWPKKRFPPNFFSFSRRFSLLFQFSKTPFRGTVRSKRKPDGR